ncbi:hypothetical protein KAR91_45025 [Candidatus Pacearchaeota archaeon]|nr:hypothetical protein [Candidatus Pacearchaeota archaeon]
MKTIRIIGRWYFELRATWNHWNIGISFGYSNVCDDNHFWMTFLPFGLSIYQDKFDYIKNKQEISNAEDELERFKVAEGIV